MLTYGYRWKSDPLNWNLFNCCDHWIALPGFETVVNDIDGTTVNQSRKYEFTLFVRIFLKSNAQKKVIC